jgi:hypothetical protein
MKIIITEQQYNKAIDKYLTYVFEPHEEITYDDEPDSIFWVKDGDIIAEIENLEYFWIRENIWEKIYFLFSLKGEDIQQVIKQWLEKYYGLGGLTPYS